MSLFKTRNLVLCNKSYNFSDYEFGLIIDNKRSILEFNIFIIYGVKIFKNIRYEELLV